MVGLIGFIIVCLVIKAVLVDVAYAVRWGKPTPRTQMKMAQLNAAAKNGQQAKPGLTDYLGTVWGDVWADVIAGREAKRANRGAAAPKQRGPMGTFLDNWWNDGWARAEAKRAQRQGGGTPAIPGDPATPAVPATPTPAAPGTPASPTTPPATGPQPTRPGPPATPAQPTKPGPPATPADPATGPRPADPATPATPASPSDPVTPADPATGPQPAGGSDDPWETETVQDTVVLPRPARPSRDPEPSRDSGPAAGGAADPATGPQPADPATPGQSAPQTPDSATPSSPGEGPAPMPVDSHDGQPLADVIPLRKENPTMSDATPGEVSGLLTAQQYAAQMSTAMANQVPMTESFMASLTSADVTGDAVAAAARAQEISAAASQAWSDAKAALDRQNTVREAYSAVPEAGTKDFVTGE